MGRKNGKAISSTYCRIILYALEVVTHGVRADNFSIFTTIQLLAGTFQVPKTKKPQEEAYTFGNEHCTNGKKTDRYTDRMTKTTYIHKATTANLTVPAQRGLNPCYCTYTLPRPTSEGDSGGVFPASRSLRAHVTIGIVQQYVWTLSPHVHWRSRHVPEILTKKEIQLGRLGTAH